MEKQRYKQLVAGIDVGTSAVRIALGSLVEDMGHKTVLQVIGTAEMPSEGVTKGAVTSIEDAISSVSGALEQAERLTGVSVERAWVSLSGSYIQTHNAKGVVAIAKADGEIGQEDVERVMESAKMVAPPLNYDMMHVLPRSFSVDGQVGIKDPTGMTGIRLEVEALIVYGLTTHIKNIERTVHRVGLEVEGIVCGSISTGPLVTTERQRDLGVAVLQIGSHTSQLVVYENDEVLCLCSIPVGGQHVTNDIAVGLRTSIDVAEGVKKAYGHAVSGDVQKKTHISLEEFGVHEDIEQKYLAQIIEARMEELFGFVDKELQRIGKSGQLPSGVVLTGGGAALSGSVELARSVLRLPASLGYPVDIVSSTDRGMDISFTGAIGLLRWGAFSASRPRFASKQWIKTVDHVVGSIKKMFQSLLP